MRSGSKKFAFLLASLALLSLTGCGGGASGSGDSTSTTTTSATRAALDVYVTDAFTDQYKQVLATLYKIELTTDGTNYTTVYSSDAGQTLDLASLASTSELLASVTVPTGTYTKARITFGDHITLVSNSGTSSSVGVDPSAGTAANGQVAVVVATPTKVQANQNNTIFVDFKLAEFQLTGNVLKPSIGCGPGGSGAGGDGPGGPRMNPRIGHLFGTVASLNGTASFTLQTLGVRTVTVNLSSTTTITDGQTGAAATLANGQSVIVDGKFDPTTHAVTATSVTLNDYIAVTHARVDGTVASINAASASFALTVQRADNFTPTSGTITVVTNAGTLFGRGMRQQGAFSNIAVSGAVDVDGSFDTTTQTLTAKFVGLR